MRQRRAVIFVVVLAFLATACGTRLKDSAFTAAATKGGSGVNGTGSSDQSVVAGDQAGTDQSATGTNGTGTNGTGTGTNGTGTGTAGGTNTGTGGTGGAGNTASDVGVTATSIKVGNVTSIGGSLGPNAFGVTLNGLRIFVSAINDQGGINGRKLSLATCDDSSDGTQFLSCIQREAQNDKVFAFLANNSDASAQGASYEYKNGIPDLGFPLNNGYYKYPNMYSIYGVGYPRDGKTVGVNNNLENQTGIYRYFKQQAGVSKAAVFYYVIPVSKQTGCFTEDGLTREGITTVYEGGGGSGHCQGAGENPAAPAFDSDVINMRSKGVDNVWDAMDVSANQRLCEAMDRQNYAVKAKVSTIEVWGEVVKGWNAQKCRNSIYIAGSSTPYGDTSNQMVSRFQADKAKYGARYPQHQWTLEGWALGFEFSEAVKSMGANVTRKGFMAWLEGLHDYTMNGLFTPFDYKKIDYSKPKTDCNAIVQWQDSVNNFVTRAGTNYCPVTAYFATPASDDGA